MNHSLPDDTRPFRRPISPSEWWFLADPEQMRQTLRLDR
jgi:hypothetical protein